MTQEFLHLADICAASQQMGGEGVAEGVGAYLLVDACALGCLLDDGEYHHAREACASVVEKERVVALLALAALLLIERDALACDTTHRHKALLVSLADNAYVTLAKAQVAELQVAQLRHAQSARVEQLQYGTVAQSLCG